MDSSRSSKRRGSGANDSPPPLTNNCVDHDMINDDEWIDGDDQVIVDDHGM
jgi:hypothetical protein